MEGMNGKLKQLTKLLNDAGFEIIGFRDAGHNDKYVNQDSEKEYYSPSGRYELSLVDMSVLAKPATAT
jgi:hypothetical protein